MTSIAGYLASLAGGVPQEGQKGTQANAPGAIGIFSALLGTTETGLPGLPPGNGGSGTQNQSGLPIEIPLSGAATDVAVADVSIGEILAEGLDLPAGEVEAAIVEPPVTGEETSAAPLAGTEVPELIPVEPVKVRVEGDVEQENPEAVTDEPAAVLAPATTEDGGAADTPASPNAVSGEEIPVAVVPEQTGLDEEPAGTAEPESAQTGAIAPQSGVHATPEGETANTTPEARNHPPGLQNALARASEQGKQNGLANALSRAPHARETGQAPSANDGEPRIEQAIKAARPEIPDRPSVNNPLQGRPEFIAPEVKTVQRLVDAGNGQTQIQIHAQAGSETAGVQSPPTLTVNVPASATSPGPASPNTPHVPVSALAVHIAQQAHKGARRFDIRLDPPELGRIEVRLDVSREGHVMTHLVVERAETLDLLQRDVRHLERALQDAGLNTSDEGMKFSLKDQGLAKGGNGSDTGSDDKSASGTGADGEADQIADDAMPPQSRYLVTSGLDIRI